MLARVGRLKLKHGLLVLLSVVLAACAGVLGIEERTLDTPSTYPLEGYDGCRPGTSCDGCLDVHRPECDIRDTCADTQSLGVCGACVCDNCVEPVVDCQLDAGCAAIWQCLQQTRCDLSESAASSCVRDCQSVIDANGGLGGHAFSAAVAIRSCAVSSACLSCLPESPAPPPGCRPQNGCADCADCFQQCLCSGDTFSSCRGECREDAPSEACSEQDNCVGCSSCFDVCACRGGDFAECTSECQEQTPDACADGTNCLSCDGCVSHCVCNGGGFAQCEQACQPPATTDVCRESTQGTSTCGGCGSCLAACTCQGEELDDCMDDCGLPGCCGDISGCESEAAACVCGGTDIQDCVKDYTCELGGCDSCACGNCHDTFALCRDTRGCDEIFDCMRTTQCQGSACTARCATAYEREAPHAFDIAESLWACSQRAGCACADEVAFGATCGTTTCDPYVGVNAGLDACCVDTTGETGPLPAEVVGEGCGLTLQGYVPNPPSCTPLDQQRPPQEPESCPPVVITSPPYNGASLQGCCRSADGWCGYWDDITGLGCLDPGIFGASTEACP